jgi:hypothetical protein
LPQFTCKNQKIKRTTLEIIFADESVSIAYNRENSYLLIDFQAYEACREVYQRILEDTLSLVGFKDAQKIIFDQSKKSFFRKEDTQWAFYQWLPKLAKYLGNQAKLAIILPAKFYFPLEHSSKMKCPFQNKAFTSLKEAENWLKS